MRRGAGEVAVRVFFLMLCAIPMISRLTRAATAPNKREAAEKWGQTLLFLYFALGALDHILFQPII